MVQLAFGMAEVREWASFSGDFNPIHFDLTHARSAGLDGLVVHGMLALLPIKSAVSEISRAAGASESTWRKFQARFRRPIPLDSSHTLTVKSLPSDRIDFRLACDDADGQESFRGSYSPTGDASGWLASNPVRDDSFTRITAEDVHRFWDSYGEVRESWVALDALVFSSFMQTRLEVLSKALQLEFEKLTGHPSVKHLFVQVSHTVHVDVRQLPEREAVRLDWGSFSYAMGPPVTVATLTQLTGTVTLPVMHSGNLVMLVEIGLLARPLIN